MLFGKKITFDEAGLWLHDPEGYVLFRMQKTDVSKIEGARVGEKLLLPVQHAPGGHTEMTFQGDELAALRGLLPSMWLAMAA